jgi:hypothetical protein
MSWRRALILAGAVAAFAAAAVVLAIAVDVLRWRGHLQAADLRFSAASGSATMWEPDTRMPTTVSRALVGVEDDLAYRRTVQLFRLSRLGLPARDLNDVARRGRVDRELARLDRTTEERERRALVANLQGVLAIEEAREDSAQATVLLRRSVESFRKAIFLDQSNEHAKYNLELVLRLLESAEEGSSPSSGGQRGDTTGSGAGAASQGSGY